MPNITEYTAPIDKIATNESGPSVVARGAIRIGALAREAGSLRERGAAMLARGFNALGGGVEAVGKVVTDHQAATEISDFTNALMQTHEALDNQWNQTRSQADLSVEAGPQFRQNVVGPTLDKLVEGMATKKAREHAQSMVNNAKMHYFTTTHADDMAAAGDNVVRNMQTVVDGATRRSMNDASTIEYNSNIIRDSFEGAIKSGNLDPKIAIKLRDESAKAVKENVLSGLKGMADRNPVQLASDLKGLGEKYGLGAKEIEQLDAYARTQERLKRADAARAAVDQSVATTKKGEAELQKLAKGTVQPDGTIIPPKLSDIMSNDKMTFEQRAHAINFFSSLPRKEDPPARTDYTTAADLIGRLHDIDNPTTVPQVSEAVKAKKLTDAEGIRLVEHITSPRSSQFQQLATNPVVKGEFDKANAIIRQIPGGGALLADPSNPAVRDKTAQFRIDTLRTIQGAIEAGQDPRPYTDPKSPLYLFSPERIMQYQPSRQEVGNSIVVHPKSGEAPKPGAAPPPAKKELPPLTDFFKGLGAPK